MRRKLIWLSIVVPATLYLVFFFNEGLKAFGWWELSSAEMPVDSWRSEVAKSPELYDQLTTFGRWTYCLEEVETTIGRAIPVLIVLALGLGIINLFSVHGANLIKRKSGWGYSAIVFLSFAVVAGALMYQYRAIDHEQRQVHIDSAAAVAKLAKANEVEDETKRDGALAAITDEEWEQIHACQAYDDAYRFEPWRFYNNYINFPLQSTVMGLLGFYITYAAYRAFRIRTLEATVMMVSAAVVLLGNDALGVWLTHEKLMKVADFDNTVLNSGMQRGLLLGIQVAVIVACLRMYLGYERGIVDAGQERE